MQDLKNRIQALEQISADLDPSEQQRRSLLGEVQNFSNTFLNDLPSARAFTSEKATKAAFEIGSHTKSLQEVLDLYQREVVAKGIQAASGGHLGYIPGGGLFGSALGDFLAAITNEYSGISFASPGAVAMEHGILNWLKEVFSFPETAVGNLTSGGSIANMIGLTAARDRYGVKGARVEKSVVYLSRQLHHSNTKALRILGLEDVQIRHLQLDSNSRILASDLEAQILKDKVAGLLPYLVLASAGTTDTGAVDPLDEIADLTEAHDLWLHVDGAYGGFFILTEERKQLFKGIERADSLTIDPHKGLFVPYGLGAVLVKDKEAVFHSHHHSAHYMQDALEDSSDIDPSEVSPELTKHFRALRLWLPLQLHGIEPFVACLEEKLLLTRYFRKRMQDLGFSLGPEPDLSVTYFWWPVPEGDENAFNRHLMKEVHKDGRVFLSSTMIEERFVIRLAVLSFRTKLETIDHTIEMLEEKLREVKLV